jgi:hypothetical protein
MLMPSASKSQARLFAAVAHDPKFAKKVGIPMSVGKDFNRADAAAGNLKKGSDLPERKATFKEHATRRPYA